MTVKHTLVSLDMRVFALCSLMELHRRGEAARRVRAGRGIEGTATAVSVLKIRKGERNKRASDGADHE